MTHSQRRLSLLLLALVAGLALAAAPAGAASPGPRAQESAITVAAAPAYGGVYRPGSWLPVRVDLENGGVDRSVEVRVGVRDGAQYAAELELPNGARKSATIYVYLAGPQPRLAVRVLSGGEELHAENIDLEPANSRARVVGLLSGGAPVATPARLPDNVTLSAVRLTPADLPAHPLGLSSFDALVLEDLATVDLAEPQRAAIHEWVLRGGQLILAGGPGAERSLAGLPEPMRIASLASVDSFPATSLLGAAGEGAPDVPLALIAPRAAADGREPYASPLPGIAADGRPLLVEQSYGRGTISLFAAPLSHPAFAAWQDSPRFWADLLRGPGALPAGFAPDGVTADGFIEGNLASTLTSLPALEFPPLLAIGGLLAAYILVVGPGVYLLLRRLDRQALGWVVVPAVTLLFAGLAYGAGYALRGGDVVLNQVTLVELLDEGGQARVRSFAGLFSPARTSYALDAADASGAAIPPLLRPISLQGPWDAGVGGVGGVFLQEGAAGPQAREFEVAQWSMRAVATDTIGSYAGVDAQVQIDGETVRGTVVNNGGRALTDVTLVQGDRVARLGDIPPGERREGELTRRPNVGGGQFGNGAPLSYVVYGEEMDRNSKAGGQPLPVELQLRVRLLDALFAYGPSPRDGQPLLIAWSRDPALDVRPAEQKAELQHMALITARPRVTMAGDSVELGQGWLAPRFEGGQGSVCYGALGAGVTLGVEPTVATLTLPRDLYWLRPSGLTLLTSADGAWLPETTVELYDWVDGAWESVPAAGQPLEVSEPERYLSSHGRLRVRLSSSQAQQNFGCIYIDATLKGSMP